MSGRPVLIGLPYDASSSFLRGAADAPPQIRNALRNTASNPWSERIVESVTESVLEDLGDLDVPATSDARRVIEDAIRGLAAQGRRFIALGGDHSITYPIVRGLAGSVGALTILQIDAHPDLYDDYEGDRFSHACPFARILEEGLAARLIQVGIRAMTGHGRDQAARFGVEQIDMRAWADGARPGVEGNVYVSIDLDGLDPAFAPGVSHREPGGLTVRDVLTMIDGLTGQLVGADIVELNPRQDPLGLTAPVAAKFVKELAAKFLDDDRW
jgi:agmatinase